MLIKRRKWYVRLLTPHTFNRLEDIIFWMIHIQTPRYEKEDKLGKKFDLMIGEFTKSIKQQKEEAKERSSYIKQVDNPQAMKAKFIERFKKEHEQMKIQKTNELPPRNPVKHTYQDLQIDIENQITTFQTAIKNYNLMLREAELKIEVLKDVLCQMKKCDENQKV